MSYEPQVPKQLSAVRNFLLSFLIILATVFFVLGIILPTIRFTTIYVWTKEHSIATIIYALYDSEEYFLCAVVFAVSIFFPFLKLFYLLTLVTSPDLSPEFRRRSFSTMEWLGRYSMTDVMVLALMIFYVNSSGYTEAIVMPGVYFFAASAIITMLAYGWANTVPPRPAFAVPPEPQPMSGEIVTLPTNPGRRRQACLRPTHGIAPVSSSIAQAICPRKGWKPFSNRRSPPVRPRRYLPKLPGRSTPATFRPQERRASSSPFSCAMRCSRRRATTPSRGASCRATRTWTSSPISPAP